MSASNTDNFLKVRRNFSTLVGGGGVADGVATTIPFGSTTNLPTDTAICFTINRVDLNGVIQSVSETCVGVISGSNAVNCVRGVEGTAQGWSAGAVIEIIWTETNVNRMIAALLNALEQSGRLKTENYYATDTGAANAYAVALATAPVAYVSGMVIQFKAANTNTTISTINVNSLGVKTIKRSGGIDLDANDIRSGQIITLAYDGTNFQLLANGTLLNSIFSSAFANFVSSGLSIPTSASLIASSTAGIIFYGGIEYKIASDGGHTYTASNDCYVDVNPATGAYTYNTVANGASAPALTASSVRIAKVVTNGTAVTAVTQSGFDGNNVAIYPNGPVSLKTVGGQVVISNTAPSAGQVLTAKDANSADWETPSAGGNLIGIANTAVIVQASDVGSITTSRDIGGLTYTFTPSQNCHVLADAFINFNGVASPGTTGINFNVDGADRSSYYPQASPPANTGVFTLPITDIIPLTGGVSHTITVRANTSGSAVTLNNNRSAMRLVVIN